MLYYTNYLFLFCNTSILQFTTYVILFGNPFVILLPYLTYLSTIFVYIPNLILVYLSNIQTESVVVFLLYSLNYSFYFASLLVLSLPSRIYCLVPIMNVHPLDKSQKH